MAQLQLYITKTHDGYKSIANINPTAEIARYIRDFSAALDTVRYDVSLAPEFYLLTYVKEGVLLSRLRPIPGGEHDHYAATIFIPAGVKPSADDIHALLDAVGVMISGDSDPDAEALAPVRTLMAKDYPVGEHESGREVSKGRNYAFARYGSHDDVPAFDDYLAEGFYQPEFAAYAGVLLFPCDHGAIGMTHAIDLTRKKPAHMIPLLPPARTAGGFVPTIDREPFDKPIMVEQGSTVIINWRKAGFEPTVQEFTVTAPGMIPPQPDTQQARRIITPTTFIVTEQSSHQAVSQYDITINGRHVTGPEAFSYSELVAAQVQISAPGYCAFVGTLDLASNAQAMIQLRQLDNVYRFDLPLYTPEPVEALRLYIRSKKPVTTSPVDGYEVEGEIVEGASEVNRLVYKGRTRLGSMIFLAAALVLGLAIGLIAGWLIFRNSATPAESSMASAVAADAPAGLAGTAAMVMPVETPAEPTDSVVADPVAAAATAADAAEPAAVAETAERTPATDADYAAAAEYLQSNKVWSREALEKMPGMAGFFDDLNSYNFKQITTYWKPLLGGRSTTFDAVVRACEGAATKRDPHLAPHDPVYAPENDRINWRTYTYWVDP